MKKLLLLLTIVLSFGAAVAQKGKFDVKINPVWSFFGRPDIIGEYNVSDSFGVELTLGTSFGKSTFEEKEGGEAPTQSGFRVKGTAKYYFNPDEGCDGWYGGIYFRQESQTINFVPEYSRYNFKSDTFAGGIEFGKKWLFDSGIMIELSGGFGRVFSEARESAISSNEKKSAVGVDGTGKFVIGYRF